MAQEPVEQTPPRRYVPPRDSIYGLHVPYDRGDWVKTPNVEPGLGRNADRWNAVMIDPLGGTIKMWITDMASSFQMAGQTAQSRYYRQFFPHNFVQTAFTITGQTPNSYQYNRLAAFVRNSQRANLVAEQIIHDQGAAGVPLQGVNHTKSGVGIPTVTLLTKRVPNDSKRNVKGGHIGWNLQGYIKSMPAGAKRFDPAPQYKFDFIVAAASNNATIYNDTLVQGNQLKSWMEVFQNNFSGGDFAKNPDAISKSEASGDVANQIGSIIGSIF